MEKKISHTNDKLKSQDKPGFHRAKGEQHALSEEEKKQSKDKNASGKTKETSTSEAEDKPVNKKRNL